MNEVLGTGQRAQLDLDGTSATAAPGQPVSGAQFSGATVDLSKADGAAPEAVYQSKRTTNPGAPGFSYVVTNLAEGHAYHVRLHFADDQSWNAGNRVFNVFVNGKLVLANFDIYAAAGARLRAVVKDVYSVKPDSNGNIIIQYQNVKGNALASGISILP